MSSSMSPSPTAAQTAATNTATPVHIQFALSRDELYVLARALKITRLPGFDMAWAQAQPDGSVPHEIERKLQGATDALMARGYLKLQPAQQPGQPPRLHVPSAIISTLGACAFSRYTVLLTLCRPKGVLQIYLGQYREVGVAHSIPTPEVHVFEALRGRPGIDAALTTQLTLVNQPDMNLAGGTLTLAQLKQGREAATAGRAEAATTLFISGGLPVATAQAFSAALRDATARGTIAIAGRLANGQEVNTNAAVIISSTACFFLPQNAAQSDIVDVQPSSAGALGAWLKNALDQFPSVAVLSPTTPG